MLVISLLGCTKVEQLAGPNTAARSIAAVDLSSHVPTFDLRVSEAEFAEMSEHYLADIKVPIVLSAFRDGQPFLIDREGEVQIKGAFSAKFPLKPLGIKLEDDFENSAGQLFQVPRVAPEHSFSRVRSFRLRNGGNEFTTTLIKDLAFARMVAEADLDVLFYYGEPAAAFVNGEFYGLLNLRSEGNGHGISRLHGLKKSDLRLAELNEGENFEVKEGDEADFRVLEAAIERGDYGELSQLVDESSLIDFAAVGSLFGMWDWPWKNVRIYSLKGGKFRFVLYDFDLAGKLHAEESLLHSIRRVPDNPMSKLFEACYADVDFRRRFDARVQELFATGTLHPDRLREHLETLSTVYAPIIDLQIQKYSAPTSVGQWYVEQESAVEDYTIRYSQLEQGR